MTNKILLGWFLASTASAATIKPVPFNASDIYCGSGYCTGDQGSIGFSPEYNSIIKLPDQGSDKSEDLLYVFSRPDNNPAIIVGKEAYFTARLNFNEQGFTGYTSHNLHSSTLKANFSSPQTLSNPQIITRGHVSQSNPIYAIPSEHLTPPSTTNTATNLNSDDIPFTNIYVKDIGKKAVPVLSSTYIDNDHILISSSCPMAEPYQINSFCTGNIKHLTSSVAIYFSADLLFYPKGSSTVGTLYPADMAGLANLVQSKFPGRFAAGKPVLNLDYPYNIGDLDNNGTDDLWLEGGYLLLMDLAQTSNGWIYKAIDIKQLTHGGLTFTPTSIRPSFIGNFDQSIDGSIEFTYPDQLPMDKIQWKSSQNPTKLFIYSIPQQTLNSGTIIAPTLVETDEFADNPGFNIDGWPNHFGVSTVALGRRLIVASSRNTEGTSLWEVTPDITLKHDENILNFDHVYGDWTGPGIAQTTNNYPNQINLQSPGALEWSSASGSWQDIFSKTFDNALIPPTWTNATLHARIATNSTDSKDYNGNIQVSLIESNGTVTWLGQFELVNVPGQSYKDYAFKVPYEYINLLFRSGSKLRLTLSSGSFNTKKLILDQLTFSNDPNDNGLKGGTPQDCSSLPDWTQGKTQWNVRARGKDGSFHNFNCIPGPTNSWCTTAAYSPSTVYWPQAWKHIGICQ